MIDTPSHTHVHILAGGIRVLFCTKCLSFIFGSVAFSLHYFCFFVSMNRVSVAYGKVLPVSATGVKEIFKKHQRKKVIKRVQEFVNLMYLGVGSNVCAKVKYIFLNCS